MLDALAVLGGASH